ncbi:MAG: dihydropteroate synthase [Proteobacteria bacterium]|nr:dihydropteroate synthase [Pseudomonadota bacterium]
MICIADNIQITRKVIENALNSYSREPIMEQVRICEQHGADMIDINTGPLTRNPEDKMRFFVETVQEATSLPLMLDTSNPIALKAGLEICRNTVYINGFSLEPHKLETILPLAVTYRAKIVGYLLNPDSSVPLNALERMDRALSLFEECSRRGLDLEQLIIDPVLVPLLWADGSLQAMDVLEVIRSLPDLLGFPVKTIVGLSNLTTGAPDPEKKYLMERTYAAMLGMAGIDMVLMNITRRQTVDTLKAASILMKRRVFSWEEL